jgi:hypothetical protein
MQEPKAMNTCNDSLIEKYKSKSKLISTNGMYLFDNNNYLNYGHLRNVH